MGASGVEQAMSNLQTDVPLINVPLSTGDGRANPIWFQFFVQLWRRTGTGSGGDGQLTIADVLSYETTVAPSTSDSVRDVLGLEATLNQLASRQPDPIATEMTMAIPSVAVAPSEITMALMSDSMATQAPKAVTLGASPATYTATYRQALHITGGTVSAISLARSGTSLALAATTNLIELSAGDQVTVTYTALPTTTVLGR
jgi:hypothetical protein